MTSVWRQKAIALAIALSSLLFTAPGQGAGPILGETAPSGWTQFLELNQTRNTRLDVPEFPSGQIVPIVYFNVPEKDLNIARSRYLSPAEREIFESGAAGKKQIRVYVETSSDNSEMVEILTEKYGAPVRIRSGTRLQSIKTYLSWDSEHPGKILNSFKFPTRVLVGDDRKTVERNGKADSLSAVAINDVVESALTRSAQGSFLPERYAVAFKDPDIQYGFSSRLMAPIAPAEFGTVLLPAHGFLGNSAGEIARGAGKRAIFSPAILAAAAQSRLTPENWLVQEYAEKLGRFLAEMNFENGIYPEAHTQNLLLEYEPKSGRIARFVFQDVADIQLDPFVRVMRGKPALTSALTRAGESTLFRSSPTGSEAGLRPGSYNAIYSSQSALLSNLPEKLQLRIAAAMTESYLRQASQITGLKTNLTSTSREILSRFRAGELSRAAIDRRDADIGGEAQKQLQKIFEEIYSQTAQGLFARNFPENLPSAESAQDLLKRRFSERLAHGQVAYSADNGPVLLDRALRGENSKVEFQAGERGIAAFSRIGKQRRVLGIAYNSEEPVARAAGISCLGRRLRSF